MAIDRNQARAPVLPKEAVDVPEIGGEVIVRGLLLTERLAMFVENLPATDVATDVVPATSDVVPAKAGTQASGPDRYIHIPRMLARTVLASDGDPLWTEAQWQEFGAVNFEASLRLFRVAQRLSGLDVEEARKN
jgi:hypothetical protein